MHVMYVKGSAQHPQRKKSLNKCYLITITSVKGDRVANKCTAQPVEEAGHKQGQVTRA